MNESIIKYLIPVIKEWLLIILICLTVGYLLYLATTQMRIWYRKRSLTDYACFVVKTYEHDKVPRLIMRYYLREVESYNKLRKRFPFRSFWKEVDSDKTLKSLKQDLLVEQKKYSNVKNI